MSRCILQIVIGLLDLLELRAVRLEAHDAAAERLVRVRVRADAAREPRGPAAVLGDDDLLVRGFGGGNMLLTLKNVFQRFARSYQFLAGSFSAVWKPMFLHRGGGARGALFKSAIQLLHC